MTTDRTRRDFLAVAGTSAAVGLSGCTRGGEASSGSDTKTVDPTSGNAKIDLSEYTGANIEWKQHEGTTINVGAVQHAWIDSIRPLVPLFEELTGINVVWNILPEQQFRTKRLTDVSTGAGKFDVFFMDQVVNQFREAGWLQFLDPYFERDDLFDEKWYRPNDLLGVCREACHGAGRTKHWTGMPITVEVHTMFYRKDLYEKHGLSVPKTTDQFLHNAKVIQEEEDGMSGLVNRGQKGYGMNVYTMDAWIREYGGSLWKQYPDESGLDTHVAKRACRYYVDALQKYGPPSIGTMTWSEVVAAIQGGNAAHVMNDANLFWGSFADSSPDGGEIGVAKMVTPTTKKSKFAPGAFTWQLSTSKAARNPEAAFLFMLWATSKPTQRWMSIQRNASFPTRQSIWSKKAYKEKYGKKFSRVSLESLSSAVTEPYDAMYPVWAQKYSIQLQKAITGGKSVESALSKSAQQAELIVQQD